MIHTAVWNSETSPNESFESEIDHVFGQFLPGCVGSTVFDFVLMHVSHTHTRTHVLMNLNNCSDCMLKSYSMHPIVKQMNVCMEFYAIEIQYIVKFSFIQMLCVQSIGRVKRPGTAAIKLNGDSID